jgi:hypothetical protein
VGAFARRRFHYENGLSCVALQPHLYRLMKPKVVSSVTDETKLVSSVTDETSLVSSVTDETSLVSSVTDETSLVSSVTDETKRSRMKLKQN